MADSRIQIGEPFWFKSSEELIAAVEQFRALTPAAQKLFSEVVEMQQVSRKKISPAAQSLEDAGFASISEVVSLFTQEVHIRPLLHGEEMLAAHQGVHALEYPAQLVPRDV